MFQFRSPVPIEVRNALVHQAHVERSAVIAAAFGSAFRFILSLVRGTEADRVLKSADPPKLSHDEAG